MTGQKKTLGHRFFGLAMVFVLMLTMLLPNLTLAANAAGTTIDEGKTGSLTIYKYKWTDEVGDSSKELGSNPTQEDMKNWIDANGKKVEGLDGVVFSYLKVGDVKQHTTSNDGGSTVTIGYSVNEGFMSLLKEDGNETALAALKEAFRTGGAPNETIYYTPSSLDAALEKLTQTELSEFILDELEDLLGDDSWNPETGNLKDTGGHMPATDEDGRTSTEGKEDLKLGLYLVVETGYPANIITTTAPFFVSIPMTDSKTVGEGDDEETTYEWLYDVTAYPKNTVEDLYITKSVVGEDGESMSIDAEIGEPIQFIIRADFPAAITVLEKFVVKDTLDETLTYIDENDDAYDGHETEVRGLKADGTADTLENEMEYTFEETSQTLTFTFDTDHVNLTDTDDEGETVSKYTQIEITYWAYLNENAQVGTANKNSASFEIESNTGPLEGLEPADPVSVYTYAISLQKQFNGETTGSVTRYFSNVTFELYRDKVEDGNKIAVAYDENGSYWYVAGEMEDEDPNYTITLEADGKLNLWGLKAGTYYLEETGTANGYNLLTEPIEIVITSNEGTYGADSTTPVEEANPDFYVYYYESEEGTFAKIDDGYKYATDREGNIQFTLPDDAGDGDWINFGTSDVWQSNDGRSWNKVETMYTTNDLQWKATVGGSDVTDNNGTFGTINVNNQSGFDLPQTGGSGTIMFLVGGGVLVVAAVAAIFVVTRKKKENM